MNRNRIGSFLLVLVLMLCPIVSSLAEEADAAEDPIVVRVGDISYM